ncbi:hypothetical protein AC1031_017100 [Aphanomyces cochlioides]|nr:hypothetical protein AC1031_017100 [Aphanomyces cochlioides]
MLAEEAQVGAENGRSWTNFRGQLFNILQSFLRLFVRSEIASNGMAQTISSIAHTTRYSTLPPWKDHDIFYSLNVAMRCALSKSTVMLHGSAYKSQPDIHAN